MATKPICPLCEKTQLRGKFRDQYGFCAKCCKEDVRSQGRAEILVKKQLEMHGFEMIHNQSDPRTRARVASVRADFRIIRSGSVEYDIVIEVDEDAHRTRPPVARDGKNAANYRGVREPTSHFFSSKPRPLPRRDFKASEGNYWPGIRRDTAFPCGFYDGAH